MKFLSNNFRDFRTRSNLIYMTNDVGNSEGKPDWKENELVKKDIERDELSDEGKTKRILDLVKSPIEFSLRDIKFIEENKDLVKYNKDFKYGFRKISEYYLSLSVVKGSVMPSRILYAIGMSNLSKEFLPPKIKTGIDLVINENLKEVDELSYKDVSTWNVGQAAQVLSLYKALKVKKNKAENKKINEVFEKISKKLVEHAIDLANQEKTLTNTQQLVIWEIRRQIPESFRTSNEVGNIINEESQIQAQDLLQKILESEKNTPDLVLLWDVLEDLAYQHNVSVNEDDKKKLRNFILRGNATHLLESIKKSEQKVLLPIHLRALKQLESENFKNLWEATDNQFELKISKDEEKKKKQAELDTKKAGLEAQKNEIKDKVIDELLESDKITDEEKKEGKEKRKELEVLFNEELIGNKTLKNTTQEVLDIFQTSSQKQKLIKDNFDDKIYNLTYRESSNHEKFDGFKELVRGLEKMKRIGWENLISREAYDEENQAIQFFTDDDQNALDSIFQKLNSGTFKEKAEKLSNEVTGIEQKLHKHILQDDQNKLTKLEAKLAELKSEEAEDQAEKTIQDKIFEIYKDPETTREELLKNYDTGLNQRIKDHKLHAADFQVLLDTEDRPEGSGQEHPQLDEFRDKFKEVLDGIDVKLSEVKTEISSIDLDDPKPNLDSLSIYFKEIEEQIGISAFREKLSEDLTSFQQPQIKDEILKGLMGHFHKEINEKLESAIGGLAPDYDAYRNQQDFFLNQVRTHTNINTASDIKHLDAAYLQYFDKKINLDKNSEVERNKLEGVLEGMNDSDKEKIRDAYDYGNSYLKHGYKNKDFQFPGSQKLNQAALESKSLVMEFGTFNQRYSNKLDNIISDVSENKDIDLSFQDFYRSWKIEGKIELTRKIKSFENLCENVIFTEKDQDGELVYKEFLKNYFETITKAFDNIEAGIEDLNKTIISGHQFTGKEQIWTKIKSDFSTLKSYVSFDEGKLTRHQKTIEDRLFAHKEKDDKGANIDVNGFSETVQNLKTIGVFDERVSAQKEFDEMRMSFAEKAKAFDDSSRGVRLKIELDQTRLNDEKFEEKYGMHKNEANVTLSRFGEYKGDFDEQWNRFDKKDYFDIWWDKYQKDDENRFEAIREFQDIERLTQTVEEMADKAKNLDKWLEDWNKYGETERKNRWYNRIGTQSFSLYSIYLLVKQNMEIVETRWKRNQDRMAYNVGQQIYGDSAWGKEFRRMSEDSEGERVKQWESNYNSLDVWYTADYLYKTKDPDEAKACIILLNNKGYLKWDNPRLWRTLMRLQNSVTFNIPEDMSLEIKEITRKVGDACEIIWSKDDFNTWDTSIDENIKKAKGGYEKEFRDLTDSRNENNESMLAVELSSMLEKWKKGDTEDVYPDKFYSFLHLAFEQGKLNGQPDKRWYYLIKGVTTKNPQGESLLPKTVFQNFNVDLLQNMPYFDFFIDKNSWKKDGRIVPEGTSEARQGIWRYEDYIAWGEMMGDGGGNFFSTSNSSLEKSIEKFFYDIVDMSDAARGRVTRMGRGTNTNADHDDGETFFTGLEEEQVLQLLSSRSEGTQQVTHDFWRAYLGGFDRFMKNRKRFISENDQLYGKDDPNWQKMRKKVLRDVGVKLKTGSLVIQVLSGNKDSPNQTPLIFNEKSWQKDFGDTTIKRAQDSKDEINGMLFNLIDNVDGNQEYKDILRTNSYKTTTDIRTLREDKSWTKDLNGKMSEFFSDEKGGIYFSDTEAIWGVLENYGDSNSGLSMAI